MSSTPPSPQALNQHLQGEPSTITQKAQAEGRAACTHNREGRIIVISADGTANKFGVWDTVSSVGITRGASFPETVNGMAHVCHFRHALALDERRVKFWPEHASSEESITTSSEGDVKEVWFAGCHSDIGGGSVKNRTLKQFGPALQWMTYEAMKHGLQMTPYTGEWTTHPPTNSLNWLWSIVELLQIRRPSSKLTQITWWPHLGAPRYIQDGQ
ncbi:hypothetical protein PLEOSDRAFT_1111875 [Pleurotus ostreatus PC15]|uniref:T6SS Phospholipase effector Tle1-like catalytic domain-containing protein n=1 Tax=Pleurotus ostreatus (strain PC15) TaxID=1137138 RepID=A0A067NKW0_PLEO1|nr:hypothetical protein PLEOSDRAFT_1111875 [Pleurotus ostreatus PC15]